ncbi:MAG: uL13 family ribosomal protein, partial [Fimbriimonadales bacterium]
GNKMEEVIYHHTMHPGGLRAYTRRKMMTEKPEKMVTRVVSRMLPKNKLRARMLKRLRVFQGAEHPHAAQQPQIYPL